MRTAGDDLGAEAWGLIKHVERNLKSDKRGIQSRMIGIKPVELDAEDPFIDEDWHQADHHGNGMATEINLYREEQWRIARYKDDIEIKGHIKILGIAGFI